MISVNVIILDYLDYLRFPAGLFSTNVALHLLAPESTSDGPCLCFNEVFAIIAERFATGLKKCTVHCGLIGRSPIRLWLLTGVVSFLISFVGSNPDSNGSTEIQSKKLRKNSVRETLSNTFGSTFFIRFGDPFLNLPAMMLSIPIRVLIFIHGPPTLTENALPNLFRFHIVGAHA
jgi:hypothetical protein